MKTTIAIFALCAAMLSVSCAHNSFSPQDGDLIFCVSTDTPMSQAITSATSKDNGIQYDHVAIFATLDGIPSVIEATSKYGVRTVGWEEYLSQADQIGGKPGIDVMRITEEIDIDAAIKRALSFLGQDYDWYYLPSNGLMYCSELVYESFLRKDGSHLFTTIPMNFRDKDGNMPEFWTGLFAKHGKDVPEGKPGTNPNSMAGDPSLQLVFRYFGSEVSQAYETICKERGIQ